MSFEDMWAAGNKKNTSEKFYVYEKLPFMPNLEESIKDSYMCINPMCKHIYRHYKKDIEEFHKTEYRKIQQTSPTDNRLTMGSSEEVILKKRRFMNALHILQSVLARDQDVLEVASGRGYFLLTAKNYFKSLTGMDIDPKTKEHNAIINPDTPYIVSNILEYPENKQYDSVVAFDVLEHIEDIGLFVEKMHSIARKSVVIQVPVDRPIIPPNAHLMENIKPYVDDAGNKISMGFDGHIQYFSENSLNNLFTKDNLFKCVFMGKAMHGQLATGCEILAVFAKQ